MPRPDRQVTDRLVISDVPAYIQSICGFSVKVWTIHRWTIHGRKSYSNRVIKLRYETILGKKFTRKSWVNKFIQELEL